ncbi:unnamed protein product [Danaus chrysippus]|uniref:(African queen) hypothetical protein n=1 Tax=Danaus chrysippus TaxID=151541 RepID=A0A8J2R196_9NEOP|nr:unnamed protein product [Danaus chrysippus]
MLGIRSLLKSNTPLIKNAVVQRNMSGLSTPARNKVTRGELIFLSGIMVVSWLSIPAYVLVNIKNYRDKN